MRVLAANPDTLGDLVLRQPLYTALMAAGHELTLIVRPGVVPLVRYVAPGARVLTLPHDVFSPDLEQHWDKFEPLIAEARSLDPELLLVASYQWTAFEERLADALPGVPRAGMSGVRFRGDAHRGHVPPSSLTFDITATVAEELPEPEKNAALASAVLRRPVSLDEPRITPDASVVERARGRLVDLGLTPGDFWAVCVGGTAHVQIKAWPTDRWARTLGTWAERSDRRFLFIGTPDERPTAERVREGMGQQADSAVIDIDPGYDLDWLIATLSLSAGYVGHDTGPMHVAAALGKPVLAVFGGGHWPRFLPNVSPSCSLTVGVPCVGCGWICAFASPHCVSQLSVEDVLTAVDDLEHGRVTDREARALPASRELLDAMVRQGRDTAERAMRDTADAEIRRHGERLEFEAGIRYRDEHATAQAKLIDERGGEIVELRQNIEAHERQHVEHVRLIEQRGGEIEALRARVRQLEQVEVDHVRLIEQRGGEIVALRDRVAQFYQDPISFLLTTSAQPPAAVSFQQTVEPGLVSVIIPAYKAASFLEGAVRSVFEQAGQDVRVEILICEDGSPDDTFDVATRLAAQAPVPVQVLTHPGRTNRGVSATRNLGLSAARGEFVGLLDADDRWLADKLRVQLAFLRDHPQTTCVCSFGHNRDADGKAVVGWNGNTIAGDYRHVPPPNDYSPPYTFEQLVKGDPIVNSTLLIRRAALEAIGGYPRLMAHQAEDWLLLAKLALTAPIELIPQELIVYTVHEQSYTTRFFTENLAYGARLEFFHHLLHWMIQHPDHRERGERLFRQQYPRMIGARAGAYKLIEDYYVHHNGRLDNVGEFESHLSGLYAELEQLRLYAGERERVMHVLRKIPGLQTMYGAVNRLRAGRS